MANNCSKLMKEALDSFLGGLRAIEDAIGLKPRWQKELDINFESDIKAIDKQIKEYLDSIDIPNGLERIKYLKSSTDNILNIMKSEKDVIIKEYNKVLADIKNRQLNPEFKKWVANGEVKLVYHGTSNNFSEFKPELTEYSIHNIKGVYTSEFSEIANSYALLNKHSGANVMPLIIRSSKMADLNKVYVNGKLFGLSDTRVLLNDALKRSKLGYSENTRIIKGLGYDTLKDGTTYISLQPNNIKSRFNRLFTNSNDIMKTLPYLLIGLKYKEITENYNDK